MITLKGTASKSNSVSGVTSYANNVQFRAWGAVKSATFGDGRSETIPQFNSLLQPTQYRLTQGASNLQREDFTYNNDARIQTITDLDDGQGANPPMSSHYLSRLYTYDHAGRTVNAAGTAGNNPPYGQNYGYDEFNNLNWRQGTYNSQSAQLDAAVYTNGRRTGWQYDADGRLTVSPANSSSNGRTWTYDAAGRLITTVETATNNTTTTFSSGYDGDGQVVSESVTGVNPNADYLIHSTVLDGGVLTKLNAVGNKQTTYVPAGGLVNAQQAIDLWNNPNVNWVHRDPLGLTEYDGGYASYDPLGNYIRYIPPPPPPQQPPTSASGSYGPSYGSVGGGFANANNYSTGCFSAEFSTPGACSHEFQAIIQDIFPGSTFFSNLPGNYYNDMASGMSAYAERVMNIFYPAPSKDSSTSGAEGKGTGGFAVDPEDGQLAPKHKLHVPQRGRKGHRDRPRRRLKPSIDVGAQATVSMPEFLFPTPLSNPDAPFASKSGMAAPCEPEEEAVYNAVANRFGGTFNKYTNANGQPGYDWNFHAPGPFSRANVREVMSSLNFREFLNLDAYYHPITLPLDMGALHFEGNVNGNWYHIVFGAVHYGGDVNFPTPNEAHYEIDEPRSRNHRWPDGTPRRTICQ